MTFLRVNWKRKEEGGRQAGEFRILRRAVQMQRGRWAAAPPPPADCAAHLAASLTARSTSVWLVGPAVGLARLACTGKQRLCKRVMRRRRREPEGL